MRPRRNANTLPSEPAPQQNKRRRGRIRCEDLTVKFEEVTAEVLDFSASGMRIRTARPPGIKVGDCGNVAIVSPAGSVSAKVCVVWITHHSFRTHDIGIRFVELDENTRGTLVTIARVAAENKTPGLD